MIRPAAAGASLLIAAALVLTSCSGSPANPVGGESPTPAATSPTPTASPTGSPPAVADPTCDTIISPAIVAEFENVGWTARADAFRIGELELAEGVQCTWADFTIATDQVQIYGWAPISAEQATAAQQQLVANGWRRESGPDGVYITESPETTVATDADGYGLTYLFGDGWVKHADTKQGLLLVVWPPAA